MKTGDKITIVASEALKECKLEDLVGREGVILEINYAKNGSVKGCWVELDGPPYLDEPEWYIPKNSLSHDNS